MINTSSIRCVLSSIFADYRFELPRVSVQLQQWQVMMDPELSTGAMVGYKYTVDEHESCM